MLSVQSFPKLRDDSMRKRMAPLTEGHSDQSDPLLWWFKFDTKDFPVALHGFGSLGISNVAARSASRRTETLRFLISFGLRKQHLDVGVHRIPWPHRDVQG
jgi:hypothetical protein